MWVKGQIYSQLIKIIQAGLNDLAFKKKMKFSCFQIEFLTFHRLVILPLSSGYSHT